MTAILICGGTVSVDFLKNVRTQYKDAVVYAVEGGLSVADEANILQDLKLKCSEHLMMTGIFIF